MNREISSDAAAAGRMGHGPADHGLTQAQLDAARRVLDHARAGAIVERAASVETPSVPAAESPRV